ncbi:MAG: DUF58 domain-containing protein, partial [Candidatus Korarchaeota archaeon]|nr:DUF58 domain-containing protein [Candidatus Korarchaeota archaeon]
MLLAPGHPADAGLGGWEDACRQATIAARTARTDAASLFYGTSRTRVKGIGLEYVDFREYSLGDDVRHIDWRLSARMVRPDGEMRLMVKEYEAERRVHAVFAVDLSASMLFGDKIWSLVYSASLASHLASRLEDEVTLVTMGPARRVQWRLDPGLVPSILRTMVCRGDVGGDADLEWLAHVARRTGPAARLLLFTDYDHEPGDAYAMARGIRMLGGRGHAVVVCERAEVEPPVQEDPLIALRGLEAGGPVVGRLSELYEEIQRHVRALRAALASGRIGVLEIKGRRAALRAKTRIL